MNDFDVSVGLEVHVQLKTETKMFCGCANAFNCEPNTNVCPVCMGYPGAMPVMNRKAVEYTVKAGLMIDCDIGLYCKFDRKSYFYPDMPKNYQITQYELPFCLGGGVDIETDDVAKRIRITRIHLEEDVAKNTHFAKSSGVDYNRAGVPLMEIVSEPDITSADEAMAFLTALKQQMVYAGVSECNLEEGNMRCDINCSLRPKGQSELGTKTEIKNMNTFKGVHAALSYEIERQADVLREGGTIVQETRRWDVDQGVTTSMRTKEDAHDYRYFPEPDLMPVELADEDIQRWADELPEAPAARRERFVKDFQLPEYDAGVLVSDRYLADYFESVLSHGVKPKSASNWIMTEVLRVLSEQDQAIAGFAISADRLAALIALTEKNVINSNSAKEVFAAMLESDEAPEAIVEARGMAQVSDEGAIRGVVEEAVAANQQSAEDYRNGKEAALKFLVGQVMRLSKGKANPQLATRILKEMLDA